MDTLEQLKNVVEKFANRYKPASVNDYDEYMTTSEITDMIRKVIPSVEWYEVTDALLEAGFTYDLVEDVGYVWLMKKMFKGN